MHVFTLTAVETELINAISEIQFALETMHKDVEAQSRVLNQILMKVSTQGPVVVTEPLDGIVEFPLENSQELNQLEDRLKDKAVQNTIVSSFLYLFIPAYFFFQLTINFNHRLFNKYSL